MSSSSSGGSSSSSSQMEAKSRHTVGEDWKAPSREGKLITGLKLNNSMTGCKTEFIPERGSSVNWYACGPTVYDAAHLGHARTYVCFDVLRRVLERVFNFQVRLVMNITDIDDKIILRSQQQGVDFLSLARHWEKEFFEDMKALNVKLPTAVTRVSEYIGEVLQLIEEIEKNGFAYESQGSVYFDSQQFSSSSKHKYGRMEPASVAIQERVLEGEGTLGVVSSEKKNPCDFALWKKAKPGEPSWDSKWGPGRPGWHIECSAMASALLPFPLDIHSGGIDLRFPHHDNELAQTEAAKDRPQWVNYFLHSGHLHIQGSKMSKSLKNFITIKECLKQFSARHIRFLCLMNRWDSPMNYSPDGESLQQAREVDKIFLNFFSFAKSKIKKFSSLTDFQQRWTSEEFALSQALADARQRVRAALLDNVDTPEALVALQHLVSAANNYLNKTLNPRVPLLKETAEYVFEMLQIFGIVSDSAEDLNYEQQDAATAAAAAAAEPFVDCIAEFREKVRSVSARGLRALSSIPAAAAAAAKEPSGEAESAAAGEPAAAAAAAAAKELFQELLLLSDELRDKKLPQLGVLLQDSLDGSSSFRISTKEEVLRELQLRKVEEQKKEAARELERKNQAEALLKKQLEAQIEPKEYFKETQKGVYGTFDEEGIPLTFADGKEIPKSQRKNLAKLLEKHKKAHEKYHGEKKP